MQQRMHVDALAQGAGEVLGFGAFRDLHWREVLAVRVLSVEKGGGDPDLVGDFQIVRSNNYHDLHGTTKRS